MHQYLFHIGDFPIRMYGLIMCLSIMLATATAWFLARQDGRWHDHVLHGKELIDMHLTFLDNDG